MGNRLAKPPPPGFAGAGGRGKRGQIPRPFPPLTPQSYLPGGGLGGFYPSAGPAPFPSLAPNSFIPPPPLPGSMEPPIMNFNNNPSILPPSASYPSMLPSMMPPGPGALPPPLPYPAQPPMPMVPPPPPPMYDPGLASYSRRRPVRICRPRRSRRCRPVIHIVDSDSCSSISSYRSLSPCYRRRRRSRSCSRRRAMTPPPQQPIIVLPVQCQQPSSAIAAPVTNAQPQQIVLPPIHVQQSGQYPSQQLALPPINIQALGGQQQPLALPPIPMNGSSILPTSRASPMVITAPVGAATAPALLQPSASLPQITTIPQGQPMQAGRIQYVQAMPQSSSPLQYVTSERRSNVAPVRTLVNSTNKRSSSTKKPLEKSMSTRQVPQMDLKYGRRPFDWYKSKGKDDVLDENIQIGQR